MAARKNTPITLTEEQQDEIVQRILEAIAAAISNAAGVELEEEPEDDVEEDDVEEDEDADDVEEDEIDEFLSAFQDEYDAIPASVEKQATAHAKGWTKKDKQQELITYLALRGLDEDEATEIVNSNETAELNAAFKQLLSRFITADGELVEDFDTPYKATRIVDGEEDVVDCCNGLPMEGGACQVNPDIKAPKPKRAPAKKAGAKKKAGTKKKTTTRRR